MEALSRWSKGSFVEWLEVGRFLVNPGDELAVLTCPDGCAQLAAETPTSEGMAEAASAIEAVASQVYGAIVPSFAVLSESDIAIGTIDECEDRDHRKEAVCGCAAESSASI